MWAKITIDSSSSFIADCILSLLTWCAISQKGLFRYHVAYHLPRGDDRMVVAEVLDFPGVLSQGFDLADARPMIARR